ncbi:MAG: GspE/PulE/PilB domain-containing protein, partial [Solirubrobacteraceae bacterium]
MTDHRPHLHAVAAEALQGPPEPWTGIRPPRRRGGSSRFLTDVLVELGYVDQARVAHATDKARAAGSPPERVLLDEGAITHEQLSHAVAERYGLDHLDLGVFKVDMGAVNLLSASAAKRYSAVPVAYVDEHTVMVAMSDPANVLAVD